MTRHSKCPSCETELRYYCPGSGNEGRYAHWRRHLKECVACQPTQVDVSKLLREKERTRHTEKLQRMKDWDLEEPYPTWSQDADLLWTHTGVTRHALDLVMRTVLDLIAPHCHAGALSYIYIYMHVTCHGAHDAPKVREGNIRPLPHGVLVCVTGRVT